ncbi:chloride channel protein [Enterococcus asini]|uniref:chloride channel protein n=1 Tax=Enterococcus asini TaxID=57732 RepID=UPI00192E44E5|nr:chloride channel protein [Enterococcus asini]
MNKQWQQKGLLLLLSLIIGLLVGALDALFGRVLLFVTDFRGQHFFYLIPFLAIAGMLFMALYQKYGGKSLRGMGQVFLVGHEEEDEIPLRLIPFVMVGTWLSHLFGGSVGREGVAVQLGATVSNWFGRQFHLENHKSNLVVIGMAAGFAGLFQTPIAATFFALELLVVGKLKYEVLLQSLVASYVASTVSHSLGLEKFTFALDVPIELTWTLFLQLILLGILFGLTGGLFAKLLSWGKAVFQNKIPDPVKRIGIGGVVISLCMLALYQGRYSGLGTNLIDMSFHNETIYFYDWLLKLLLTVLTISVGFLGGEVTPLFTIGATLGIVLAHLLGLPLVFVAALGYAAVFGSATSTLLAPIFIGGEVFGFAYLPYFFIVCAVAAVFSRGQTIYSLQKHF